MKRLLCVLLVMSVLFSLGAAVTAPTNTVSGKYDSTGQDVSGKSGAHMKASFDLRKQEGHIVVGFTSVSSSPTSVTENVTAIDSDGIALAANTASAVADYGQESGEYVAVFWQIQSSTKQTVTLSLSDDLKIEDSSAKAEDKLGWKVTVKAEDDSAGSEGVTSSNSYTGTDDSKNAVTVTTHEGTSSYTSFGKRKLEIKTGDYSGKTVGTFEGYIVVTVTEGNVSG